MELSPRPFDFETHADLDPQPRSRSVQRLRFEAETLEILRRHGGIESIRRKLGMSRRQICTELLVDPSCWTRWTRGDGSAPPHIIKMLELLLEKHAFDPIKVPESEFQENSAIKDYEGRLREHINAADDALSLRLSQLESASGQREQLTLGWKLMVVINTLLLIYLVF